MTLPRTRNKTFQGKQRFKYLMQHSLCGRLWRRADNFAYSQPLQSALRHIVPPHLCLSFSSRMRGIHSLNPSPQPGVHQLPHHGRVSRRHSDTSIPQRPNSTNRDHAQEHRTSQTHQDRYHRLPFPLLKHQRTALLSAFVLLYPFLCWCYETKELLEDDEEKVRSLFPVI